MMWKIVIWALTMCRPSWGGGRGVGACVCVCVCVWKCVSPCVCFEGFSKAPHSPNMFLSVCFTKTEEVVHDLTQPAPCRFVAPKYSPSNAACSCSRRSPWFVSYLTAWFVHVTPVLLQSYVRSHSPKATENKTKAEESRTEVWQLGLMSLSLVAPRFRSSPEYELCLRATWNPSQHDLHNAVNFLKPQSEDVPPTPL